MSGRARRTARRCERARVGYRTHATFAVDARQFPSVTGRDNVLK